ncbi:unnamed protein product [Closterium sp. Naga37s-1]|nr:unnamed protein product [Closterium sp. Naga37s-1]
MVAESSPPTEVLPHSFDSLALSSSALTRSVRSENTTGGDAGRGSVVGSGVPVEVLSSVLEMLPSLDDLATAARVNSSFARCSALTSVPAFVFSPQGMAHLRALPLAAARVRDRRRLPHGALRAQPRARALPRAYAAQTASPGALAQPHRLLPFPPLRTPESLHRARNTICPNPLRALAAAGDPGNTSLSSRTSGAAPATPEAAITSRRGDGAEGRNWGRGGAWSSPRTPSPVAAREGELIARVLRACPHLQALRVQHVCMGATFNGSPPPFHSLLSPTSPYHLPFSTSPSFLFFGQSVKADALWSTHSCFTHQAMTALASAGPAPLTALSLSPSALSPASFHTLASAFPRLMVMHCPPCSPLPLPSRHSPTITPCHSPPSHHPSPTMPVPQALDLQGLHNEPMHLAHALPLQVPTPLPPHHLVPASP